MTHFHRHHGYALSLRERAAVYQQKARDEAENAKRLRVAIIDNRPFVSVFWVEDVAKHVEKAARWAEHYADAARQTIDELYIYERDYEAWKWLYCHKKPLEGRWLDAARKAGIADHWHAWEA